jgi:hypothetical protein
MTFTIGPGWRLITLVGGFALGRELVNVFVGDVDTKRVPADEVKDFQDIADNDGEIVLSPCYQIIPNAQGIAALVWGGGLVLSHAPVTFDSIIACQNVEDLDQDDVKLLAQIVATAEKSRAEARAKRSGIHLVK